MEIFPGIEVDRNRLSGRPVIAGTRVAAADVAQMVADGDREELIEGYDLTDAQIDAAVAWWQTTNVGQDYDPSLMSYGP